IDARMPLVDRFFKVGFHDQKYMRFAYIYIRVAAPSTFCPATANERIAARSVAMAAVCAEAGVPFVPTFDALRSGGAWMRGVEDGDGAHPGAAGYEEFTRVVAGPVLDWLRSLPDVEPGCLSCPARLRVCGRGLR